MQESTPGDVNPAASSGRTVSPYGPLVNARALLSLLDREDAGGLTDSSKKLVIDSLAAAAAPSSVDREANKSGRHAFRAAIAWLRQAPGRVVRALQESQQKRPRPGAYQKRRPSAKPFRPSIAWQASRAASHGGVSEA